MIAQSIARSFKRHRDDLADRGGRAVGHQHDAVGEQQRLVNIVGDHEYRFMRFGAEPNQLVLQLHARHHVEQTERLVEQKHLGLQRKGAGDADALTHAGGKLLRVTIGNIVKAH